MNTTLKKDLSLRDKAFKELIAIREKRYFLRDAVVKKWNAALKRTHISVKKGEDKSQYYVLIEELLKGSGINKYDKVQMLINLSPKELFDIVWTDDSAKLAQSCNFTEEKARKIIGYFNQDMRKLLDLDVRKNP